MRSVSLIKTDKTKKQRTNLDASISEIALEFQAKRLLTSNDE